MTSLSVPFCSIFFRSAVSKDMIPLAGRKAAAPALAGRRWVGPACPRIPPGPSIGVPWARMRMSSMTSPSTLTGGRSPTIIRVQRSAAFLKAFFCVWVRPLRKRTVIVKAEAVAPATASATFWSALATYVSIFSVVFLALFLAALFLAAFFLAAGFAIRSSLTGLPGPDRERRIIPCSSIKVYQTDCSSRFPARAGIVSARRQHPCQPVQLFAELLVGLLGLGVEVASPSELLEARGELQGAVGCEIA